MSNREENLPLFFELIREGEIEQVRELIDSGYSVNAIFEDGTTPLISASHHGHLAMVRMLVELGADVNAIDAEQNSPLFCAKYRKFQDIANFLEPLTDPQLQEAIEQQLEEV